VRLRHPATGKAVEIDLRKQVLYLSQGGVLQRIVDISSGNNALYESDGVTYRATTPLGSFRVGRKIDGVRVSRLGELYRPAYFYSGWAIHGSQSVPAYPASHGCIRVTNPAQDRLFGLLTIGTPVTVYSG
jgi:lipoprotein-anchoring transpeptidase ErfK/SrfK